MPLPYIPFANCAEIILRGTLAEQEVILTFAVRKGSAFSGDDLTVITDAFDTWYHASLRPLLTASVDFGIIKITDLTTVSSPSFEVPNSAPTAGSLAVAVAPANVCAVVKMVTGLRGRSFRGRNYVPGIPASDLESPGTLGSTARNAIATAYGNLGSELGALGFDHVVLSRVADGVRRSVGVATRIIDYSVREPIGTQRRRVPGVGS